MNYKTLAAILHDFIMSGVSFYLALALRFSSFTPYVTKHNNFDELLAIIMLSQLAVFYFCGLYRGIWKYASSPDLVRVVKAAFLAVTVSFAVAFLYMRLEFIPRSIYIIDLAFLILTLGGGRFLYRIFRERFIQTPIFKRTGEKAIIIGAGAGGEQLLREIQKNNFFNVNIVGFVDDEKSLKGKYIHNISVIGATADLPKIVKEKDIGQVYIAIPSATSQEIRRIYEILKPLRVEIKILPRMSDILGGKIDFTKLRDIKIEDLLGREEVKLNLDVLKEMLEEKIVLVTGAGGSIGSELCVQLAQFNPSKLIAIDVSEYNAYELDQRLRKEFPKLNLEIIVSDVRNRGIIKSLFEKYCPEVVLHAAAYKHVPMMEFNPYESVRTNVLGTYIVAKQAVESKVERFVLISTDKAVNPTNVMGTTKRIAEMVVQDLQKIATNTKFMTVRFGNVLGSSGSVIPLFKRQIEEGLPLTVTSEKITRYFMSIPEATKLVLQAGAMGDGGELFVLDMGEPIRIIDLAREMISLAGLREGIDIDIKVTGLRPGEKLFEEPLMDKETSLPTMHPKVRISCAREITNDFKDKLDTLLNLSPASEREVFTVLMNEIVPEYSPFAINKQKENSENLH